ncbi:MAG: hypothetical protein M0Z85_03515 [Gammaproteobacteria bacterium]|nr:hypothetical protein [Gammaproteobacteria bacterium]
MSKFSKMVKNLQEREGYSKEVATKTAAKIGREKYGAKGMAEKAAASRGKDAIPVQETVARPEPTNYTRFGPSLDGRRVADRQARGEYVSGRELGAMRDSMGKRR